MPSRQPDLPTRSLGLPEPRQSAAETREQFATAIEALRLEPGNWLVAVSGGLDSVALLQLVGEIGPAHGIIPVVGHVDHGIHPDSAAVAALVRRHAERLGLDYRAEALQLDPDSTETAARRGRYQALRSMARGVGARGILTAHHADDQVETVLMRALRGSGPAGLAGMEPARKVDVVRPVLHFSSSSLASVVDELSLEYWDDPANENPEHLRSWIRLDLIPRLRHRLPDVDERLLDVAEQARDHRTAWDQLLNQLPGLDLVEGDPTSVSAFPWFANDSPLARQLLSSLGRRIGARLSQRAVRRALALVRAGASGRRADLGHGWEAEFSFGRLVLERPIGVTQAPVLLDGDLGRLVWQGWQVRWRRATAGDVVRGGLVTWVTPGALSVGAPVSGERLQPLGFSGRRPLVRLLQEAHVPVSRRRGWPVVRRGTEVIWLPGVCRSAAAVPAIDREAVHLLFEPNP
jgi:tRNA(Ile)-lysidine synthase